MRGAWITIRYYARFLPRLELPQYSNPFPPPWASSWQHATMTLPPHQITRNPDQSVQQSWAVTVFRALAWAVIVPADVEELNHPEQFGQANAPIEVYVRTMA